MEPVPRKNQEPAKASPKRAPRGPGILISVESEARWWAAMNDYQTSGVHDMITLRTHPYWGIRPEELHEARRRANAERAKVIRQILTALIKWRLWRAESRAAAELNPTFLPPAI
jgi:hypothetical protein